MLLCSPAGLSIGKGHRQGTGLTHAAISPEGYGFTPAVRMQAAARAVVVAQERSSNEAKSEFMSLMCHEVRTPLNGCLASAEMLLETDLQVCSPRRAAEWPAGPGIVHCRGMLGRVCRRECARRTA